MQQMSCKCNNNHYKSAIQKCNNNTQALTTTASALNMGTTTTKTGCSIVDNGANISVQTSGLYRINADVEYTSTVAGTLNVELYCNGIAMPETLVSIPVAIGTEQINVNVLKLINVQSNCCCGTAEKPIDVYAWVSDATTNVTNLSVNVLKEA